MIVNGEQLQTLEVFPNMMTVPDCVVISSNKLGNGHGEAKFYVSSKDEMRAFYGGENFHANCFMLRKDLIAYLNAIKSEYCTPTQKYRKAEQLSRLWSYRMELVSKQPDVIRFTVNDQVQIEGPRGYVNSPDKGYQLLRELALPLVSYVYVEKVGRESSPIFYWKLFVDFEAIWEQKNGPLVFRYGKGTDENQEETRTNEIVEQRNKEITRVRIGQEKYREALLQQCPYCPFTMISDERLLIASHIKPWAASNDDEKIDPYNGYALSPLYDKLFDKGFITFTDSKHVITSDFISQYTWRKLGIKNNDYVQALPMDEKRMEYLKFHRESVFKGSIE